MEVSKDELCKLMMVGTELAKEVQEIKRASGPNLDKDRKRTRTRRAGGGGRGKEMR